MQNTDLETHYQLMVTIRKLAGAYHDAAVEKMDHVFFKGSKTAINEALITLLQSRPCTEAFTDQAWTTLLTDMGYDPEQINDFTQIVLIPGQATLAEQLANYALHHPEVSMYRAMEAILKDFSHDPSFEIIAMSFQIPEAEVRGLFTVAHHYLDTMYPLEAELNLLNDFYEQHFEGFRDSKLFAETANILGKFDQDYSKLSSKISGNAEEYIRVRTQQLCQYTQLDTSQPDVAATLRAFKDRLSAEIAFLQQDNILSNPTTANAFFRTMLRPEIIWLEEKITQLGMSPHPNERQKSASLRAAYNAIPYEQRAKIATTMQKPHLNPASPIGRLKQALNLPTATYPLLDMFTSGPKPYHLSHEFQTISKTRRDSDSTAEDTDSNASEPPSPS